MMFLCLLQINSTWLAPVFFRSYINVMTLQTVYNLLMRLPFAPLVWAVIKRVLDDNISFLAGGVAFYGLLAIFPAMATVVSFYGLLASGRDIQHHLALLERFIPHDAFALLQAQLISIAKQSDQTLSLTALFSLLFTLYAATKGTKAMLAALNTLHRTSETRPWWKQQGIAFVLTGGGLLTLVCALLMIVAVPIIFHLLRLPGGWFAEFDPFRWLILGVNIIIGVMFLFALGPNRKCQPLHLVFLGATIATCLWLLTAWGFSEFVTLFPQINKIYGSLGAVMVLLSWMYASAYAVLIGAAITAVAEDDWCKNHHTHSLAS